MINEKGIVLISGKQVADMHLGDAIALWKGSDARTRLRLSFRADRLISLPAFGEPRRVFAGYDFSRLGELV